MSASDIETASPLLELFREEVHANLQLLGGGLLGLESLPGDNPRIEELARAAHAIRGAAKIVHIEPAAQLAAAIEDRLIAVQNGTRPIDAVAVEAMLAATDSLARLAEGETRDIDTVLVRLRVAGAAHAEPQNDHARQEPRPPEPVRPSVVVPSPMAAIDAPLLELFREEVRTHTQALNTGLVALEQTPGDTQKIEPLMRAAHSIKGAARVVNLDPAVRVAHLAEDCLVAAQKGSRVLTAEDIDVLLAASDLLAQMAEAAGPRLGEWLLSHAAACEELLLQLEGLVSGSPRKPAIVKAPVEAPRPIEPAQPAAVIVAEEKERVVRVTAQSLTRLMGLAGESLVEARWLQPFAGSLLKLKKQQDRLGEVLDELWQASTDGGGNAELRGLVGDARQQLADCTRALGERIGEFESHSRQSDDLNSRLYREVIASRMRPFIDGAQGFPRMVRDLARQLGKKVQFDILGSTTDVDRDILEKLEAPLNHLLRNALDHGMETPEEREAAGKPATGQLRVEARHNAGMLQITVTDDGRGIDVERLRRKVAERGHTTAEIAARLSEAELLDFLFLPGFSTAEKVTEVSGRGVGLDVVHSMVHAVGGIVRIQTRLGQGTRFQLQLPITLSVIRAVLIEVAKEGYAFPLNRIDRLLRLARSELRSLENHQYVAVDGRNVGLVLARQIFDVGEKETPPEDLFVVLFSSNTGQYGLIVDDFRGEQDLVVRPLDSRLGKVPNISAAALLDDGSPVLIADVEDLTRSIEEVLKTGRLRRATRDEKANGHKARKRVLVVDDSITVREVQRQLLGNKGFEVETAVDGLDGLATARDANFDLIISDIDMPRMNGLDFVRSLKADDRLHSIPVIIVSYKDREDDRLRGLEAGANYYLTKSSFHDDRLLNAVEELIGEP
jgi:two-component system sensor histidine kinase and response regulator WspE